MTEEEGTGILAEELREYVSGNLSEKREQEFFTLYTAYGEEQLLGKRTLLTDAAFKRYQESGLSALVAQALYGTYLEKQRHQTGNLCGMCLPAFPSIWPFLKEREEFSFEAVDMGNIYHAPFWNNFAGKLAEKKYTWFDFPKEFGERAVLEILGSLCGNLWRNRALQQCQK